MTADQPIEKKPIFVNPQEFRLVEFFKLYVPPKSTPSADTDDQDLFDAKHSLAHATFSEAEFDLVLEECEKNQEFVTKYKIKVTEVTALIKNLRAIRATSHLRYDFFVTQ